MIVHLNGWPGVGKNPIGGLLAARLGARFIHNHLLHDIAIACCGIDDPGRWDLYERVRQEAYAALVRRPLSETFVMTNALCDGSERERRAWRHVADLASVRRVPLVPVVLEAELAENQRRVVSPERVGRKMADPERLAVYLLSDTIQKPAVPELLVLDVTHHSPDQAAALIEDHVRRVGGPVRTSIQSMPPSAALTGNEVRRRQP